MVEGLSNLEGWTQPESNTFSKEQLDDLADIQNYIRYGDGTMESFNGDYGIISTDKEWKIVKDPYQLYGFVRKAAEANGTSRWRVLMDLRLLNQSDSEAIKQIEEKYRKHFEVTGVVSDIHSPTKDGFVKKLTELIKENPDLLIFVGDVVGTDDLDKLQNLFYNGLNNHTRGGILKQRPDGSYPEVKDKDLLRYKGSNPPTEDFSLRKGFLELRKFELELAGRPPEEITNILNHMSPHQIAQGIREYSKYGHFGHYVSDLSEKVIDKLASGVRENIEMITEEVKKMPGWEEKVYFIEGNWDKALPFDYLPNTAKPEPMPLGKRRFILKDFLKEKGLKYCDQITTVETKASLNILMPHSEILNFDKLPQERIDEIKGAVEKAETDGKSVVMIAHGHPQWQGVHHPSAPTGENLGILLGLKKALNVFKVREIIYGHAHSFLNKNNPNTSYGLRINTNGEIEFIGSKNEFVEDKDITASFAPIRQVGTETRSVHTSSQIDRESNKKAFLKIKK